MSLPDFLLEISRVLVGLGLAVFVGVALARLLGRMTLGVEEKDGDEEKKKIFLEGNREEERAPSPALGRAKFVAAGSLLVGVLLEVQVMGSALLPRHVARAIVLFVLVAALVYSVMVVAPKARYYEERSSAFEEKLRQPWTSKADAARRRAARIDFFGFLLALAALVLG